MTHLRSGIMRGWRRRCFEKDLGFPWSPIHKSSLFLTEIVLAFASSFSILSPPCGCWIILAGSFAPEGWRCLLQAILEEGLRGTHSWGRDPASWRVMPHTLCFQINRQDFPLETTLSRHTRQKASLPQEPDQSPFIGLRALCRWSNIHVKVSGVF